MDIEGRSELFLSDSFVDVANVEAGIYSTKKYSSPTKGRACEGETLNDENALIQIPNAP